ncbi:MAG: HEPN domain-containing protein [Planctomycetes bacterium]|nr:HEPN domain-containing protein [Planctomycetota bacterium]
MNRAGDWLEQAKLDLKHARYSRDGQDFNWACFAAQQSAEKAVKAVYLSRNLEGWGHVVRALLESLRELMEVPQELVDCGRRLDHFYIPTRYPNGFDQGKPADFFSKEEADKAISDAEKIIEFCDRQVSSSRGGNFHAQGMDQEPQPEPPGGP